MKLNSNLVIAQNIDVVASYNDNNPIVIGCNDFSNYKYMLISYTVASYQHASLFLDIETIKQEIKNYVNYFECTLNTNVISGNEVGMRFAITFVDTKSFKITKLIRTPLWSNSPVKITKIQCFN